jgi:hypothetical protein
MSDEQARFLGFLVQFRSEIQAACHALWIMTHDPRRKSQLKGGTAEWEMCGLLTGAAFSLWRAVFTVGNASTEDEGLAATERFLSNLIATNTVNFTQEQNSWSYGYYINNARFRLVEAYKCLPNDLRPSSREELKAISRMVEWSNRSQNDYPEYRSTHKALLRLLSLLDEHMASRPFDPWPATGRLERPWINDV